MNISTRLPGLSIAALLCTFNAASAQAEMPENPQDLLRAGDQAIKVNDAIYLAQGFGNTFLVITPAGNVVIDTSNAAHARIHKRLLEAADGAHQQALLVRLKTLETLRDRCRNTNERGWLDFAIRTTKAKINEKH